METGEGCLVQETRLHETRKYEEKKGACKDRFRRGRGGGNTGQAGEETSHKEKIIGSILHEGSRNGRGKKRRKRKKAST
jgi:hypothetical protein